MKKVLTTLADWRDYIEDAGLGLRQALARRVAKSKRAELRAELAELSLKVAVIEQRVDYARAAELLGNPVPSAQRRGASRHLASVTTLQCTKGVHSPGTPGGAH